METETKVGSLNLGPLRGEVDLSHYDERITTAIKAGQSEYVRILEIKKSIAYISSEFPEVTEVNVRDNSDNTPSKPHAWVGHSDRIWGIRRLGTALNRRYYLPSHIVDYKHYIPEHAVKSHDENKDKFRSMEIWKRYGSKKDVITAAKHHAELRRAEIDPYLIGTLLDEFDKPHFFLIDHWDEIDEMP